MVRMFRRLLIYFGKISPFVICFILFISYVEALYSYATNRFVLYADYVFAQKPISHFIAQYFEYDLLTVFICLIVGISVEACAWNRLATCYLALHIWFKHYIEGVEVEVSTAMVICLVNAIITLILVYKGVKQTKLC